VTGAAGGRREVERRQTKKERDLGKERARKSERKGMTEAF